jgi:hypothetical protein
MVEERPKSPIQALPEGVIKMLSYVHEHDIHV